MFLIFWIPLLVCPEESHVISFNAFLLLLLERKVGEIPQCNVAGPEGYNRVNEQAVGRDALCLRFF